MFCQSLRRLTLALGLALLAGLIPFAGTSAYATDGSDMAPGSAAATASDNAERRKEKLVLPGRVMPDDPRWRRLLTIEFSPARMSDVVLVGIL